MNTRPRSPAISHTFKEARYLDLWSLVHLATGMLFATMSQIIPFPEPWPFFIAVILMVIWEIFEVRIGVGEHMENLFTDIIVGVVGYGLALLIIAYTLVTPLILGAICALIIVILDIYGIRAYIKRRSKECEIL